MDAESNIALGDPSPSRHDFFHFRTTTFNNRQACYVNNERDNVRLLEFENGKVQAGTYIPGRQNKHRLSGTERGSWKDFTDSPKNETASRMPIPGPQVAESLGAGNWNDRTGASGSFSPRIQQHNNVRQGKSRSETLTNNFRNVFYESLNDEDRSSVRNSFDISNYLGETRSSLSDASGVRKSSPRSTTLSTSGVGIFGMNGEEMETMENSTKDEPSSFKPTVKLRKKRHVNVDMNTSWPSPQIHLMKRRSAEISELRQALEKKIRNQNSQYNRLSSDMDNYRDYTPKSEHFAVNNRPKSAYEYLYREDDPGIENKAPSTQLQNGNICSYTSRPVGLRQHNRNSAPSSIDSRKLKYLMDDHRRSSPFADQIFGPLLCQRCSNPVSFSPHAQRRTSTTYCDEGEDAESEYFTPQGSPGPRIYQPLKKTRHMEDAEGASEGKAMELLLCANDIEINAFYATVAPILIF